MKQYLILIMATLLGGSFAIATTPEANSNTATPKVATEVASQKAPSKTTAKSKKSSAAINSDANTNPATTSVITLDAPVAHESANLSMTSLRMHAAEKRMMIQVNPISEKNVSSVKEGTGPATDTTLVSRGVELEMSRGLSNGFAVNASTSIGSESLKIANAPEIPANGFSDLKVEATKLMGNSMEQTLISGFATTSLGTAAIGSTMGNRAFEGNRFSGGVSIGTNVMRQFNAPMGSYGYRLGATVLMPRRQNIKNDSPDYAVLETTGGHQVAGELFGQTASAGKWTMGGAVGVTSSLAEDYTFRMGTVGGSSTRNQMNVLGLKAFAAMNAGQLEFVPALTLERSLNSSGGTSSIESMDNLGVQLTTRLSL